MSQYRVGRWHGRTEISLSAREARESPWSRKVGRGPVDRRPCDDVSPGSGPCSSTRSRPRRSHELVTSPASGRSDGPDRQGVLGPASSTFEYWSHAHAPALEDWPPRLPTSRSQARGHRWHRLEDADKTARTSATASVPRDRSRPGSSAAPRRAAPWWTGARPRSQPSGSWTSASSSVVSARVSSVSTTSPSARSRRAPRDELSDEACQVRLIEAQAALWVWQRRATSPPITAQARPVETSGRQDVLAPGHGRRMGPAAYVSEARRGCSIIA